MENLNYYTKLLGSSEHLFTYDFFLKLSKVKRMKSFVKDEDWKYLFKRKYFLDSFLENNLTNEDQLMLMYGEPELGCRGSFISDMFTDVESKFINDKYELTVWGTSRKQERRVIGFRGVFEDDKLIKIIENNLSNVRWHHSDYEFESNFKNNCYASINEMIDNHTKKNLPSSILNEILKTSEHFILRRLKSLNDIVLVTIKEIEDERDNRQNFGIRKKVTKGEIDLIWKDCYSHLRSLKVGDHSINKQKNIIVKEYFNVNSEYDWLRKVSVKFEYQKSKGISSNFSEHYSTKVAKDATQDNGSWTFSSEKAGGKSMSEFIKVLEFIVKLLSSDYLKLTDDSSVDNSHVKKETEKSLKEIDKLDEVAKSFANKIHSIQRKIGVLTFFSIFIFAIYFIIMIYTGKI